MATRALDISAWQRVPSLEWFQTLKADGYEVLICSAYGSGPNGVGPNPYLQEVFRAAKSVGLEIATYSWPSSAVDSALRNCGEYVKDILFMALDVEAHSGVTRANVDTCREAEVLPIIYTNWSSWTTIMLNSSAFSDLPLWDAGGRLPTFTPESEMQWFVPYGGWDKRVGWQYWLDVPYKGVQVDQDVFNIDFIEGLTMNEARVREIVAEEIRAANDKHYADDHQFLKPVRNLGKLMVDKDRYSDEDIKKLVRKMFNQGVVKFLDGWSIPWTRPTPKAGRGGVVFEDEEDLD